MTPTTPLTRMLQHNGGGGRQYAIGDSKIGFEYHFAALNIQTFIERYGLGGFGRRRTRGDGRGQRRRRLCASCLRAGKGIGTQKSECQERREIHHHHGGGY